MLLRLEEIVSGFPLCAPVRGQPLQTLEEVAREKVEGYVDDSETLVTCDSEFLAIDHLIHRFENLSGAILNRDKKSKVLGLGSWKDRERWPLPWLVSVPQMKILGFIFHPIYKTMLEINWEEQYKKFDNTLFSWSTRVLDSIFQKAQVLATFALSRIWYRAQVLPLPVTWALKFESAISSFLWKGYPFNHLISLESVCQPLLNGGLGLPFLRSKCDALLLKQMVRMIISRRNCYSHICFWMGYRLGLQGCKD